MIKLLSRWLPVAGVLGSLLLPLGAAQAQGPGWEWATSPGAGHATSTVVDGAGNVYVTGYFSGTATFGATTLTSVDTSDVFVAKLSSGGTYQWAAQAGGNAPDRGLELQVDAGGNVLVAGTFRSPAATFGTTVLTRTATTDVFMAMLNPAGVWQWAVSGGASGYNDDVRMTFHATGPLYLTGSFTGTATFGATTLTSAGGTDIYVARFTPAVGWHWAVRAGGPADDAGTGLATDSLGNVYLTGAFEGTATFGSTPLSSAGAKDVFVSSLTPTGLWRRVIRGGGSGIDTPADLAMGRSGNVFITGTFGSPTATFGVTSLTNSPNPALGDLFVARFDTAGAWQWAVSAGGAGAEQSHGLAVGASGIVCVTGSFDSPTTTFGPATVSGSNDAYVAQVSATGAWEWVKRAGGPGRDVGQELAIDASDNVVMAGHFLGATMACGTTTLTNGAAGSAAVFVSRLNELLAVPGEEAPPRLAVFPNPAHHTVRLTNAPVPKVDLLDALGRVVRSGAFTSGSSTLELPLHGLAPGLYLLRCGRQTRRLVVE